MVKRLVPPAEVPTYAPGRVWLDSQPVDATDIEMRGFDYDPSDIHAPGLRDHLLVVYVSGSADMSRRMGGDWSHARIDPDCVSLTTSGAPVDWRWNSPIRVLHLYFAASTVQRTCEAMFGRGRSRLDLHDRLDLRDPTLLAIGRRLAEEAACPQAGSRLYRDSLAQQMTIHLLRHYVHDAPRGEPAKAELRLDQHRRLIEFIETYLDVDLSIAELAAQVNLSPCYFARRFKATFAMSPHRYVVSRRLDRAKRLLVEHGASIADVAAASGFSDQSHLTRQFRSAFGLTPGAWRKESGTLATGERAEHPRVQDAVLLAG